MAEETKTHVVLITNISDRPMHVHNVDKTLEPGEQVEVDLGPWQHRQVTIEQGPRITAGVTEG